MAPSHMQVGIAEIGRCTVFRMLRFIPERAGRLYADCSSHMADDVDEVHCSPYIVWIDY
jgi:hypothetical protein